MTTESTTPQAHSPLGASGADRWMSCPGSVKLSEGIEDSGSEYAAEGTMAHDLAGLALEKGVSAHDISGEYPLEMREYVQEYLDLVNRLWAENPGELRIEKQVKYDEWVPGGFGTGDAVIINNDRLIVIDLKYGKGVKVNEGPQLQIYALGAYQEAGFLYDFKEVVCVICQPRLNHVCTWSLSLDDLMEFGEEVKAASELALSDNPPFGPSEKACRWCRAKAICKARADYQVKLAMEDFGEPMPSANTLTPEEISDLLPKLDDMVAWAKSVQEYALEQAMAGTSFPGWYVAQGRATTKWIPGAMEELGEHYPDLIERKLVGITAARKILGKDHEAFDLFTQKTDPKPVLSPDGSGKTPYQSDAVSDFMDAA